MKQFIRRTQWRTSVLLSSLPHVPLICKRVTFRVQLQLLMVVQPMLWRLIPRQPCCNIGQSRLHSASVFKGNQYEPIQCIVLTTVDTKLACLGSCTDNMLEWEGQSFYSTWGLRLHSFGFSSVLRNASSHGWYHSNATGWLRCVLSRAVASFAS